MDLSEPLSRSAETLSKLDQQLPEFMTITSIAPVSKKTPTTKIISYRIKLPASVESDFVAAKITEFLAAGQFVVERVRKKKKRELDIRALVSRLEQDGLGLMMDLVHPHNAAGTNPREVLEKVIGLTKEQALVAGIKKISSQELAANS